MFPSVSVRLWIEIVQVELFKSGEKGFNDIVVITYIVYLI